MSLHACNRSLFARGLSIDSRAYVSSQYARWPVRTPEWSSRRILFTQHERHLVISFRRLYFPIGPSCHFGSGGIETWLGVAPVELNRFFGPSRGSFGEWKKNQRRFAVNTVSARVHVRPPATRGYYCALVRGGYLSLIFLVGKKGLRAHARASERVQKKSAAKQVRFN